MTKPSAIASMQFFNLYPTHSTTEQKYFITTNFFDSNKNKIGKAHTTEKGTMFTTDYFDADERIIGTSISEWLGDTVNTKYFIDKELVGASKTFWLGEDHVTNYFNLDHQVVNRSTTNKQGSDSKTIYNIPFAEELPMLTRYNRAPAEFAISPLLDEARKEAKKNSQFSPSSPTMHRAQPDNPQNEPSIKRRRGCAIL
jgi:hypothetical protein